MSTVATCTTVRALPGADSGCSPRRCRTTDARSAAPSTDEPGTVAAVGASVSGRINVRPIVRARIASASAPRTGRSLPASDSSPTSSTCSSASSGT